MREGLECNIKIVSIFLIIIGLIFLFPTITYIINKPPIENFNWPNFIYNIVFGIIFMLVGLLVILNKKYYHSVKKNIEKYLD